VFPAKSALGFAGSGVLATLMALSGCARSAPPALVPKPADNIDLKGAASYVANDLTKQLGPAVQSRKIVVDPLLDRSTGQQTGVSVRVEEQIVAALAAAKGGLTVLPFDADGLGQSRLVVTGTVATVKPPDQYGLSVAMTDPASGLVVAQSAARFQQSGLDATPTRFYNDSPSLVRDRSVEGYLKTSETQAGKLADPLYVEQLPTAALISAALTAYNEGRWEQALLGYNAAASQPSGQTLRTFNGIYLSNMRLGRTSAAEEAFGKIATLGLATNNLAVKLLFRPGTTEFLADPNFSGVYPMWIRQIARAAQASTICLNIIGHTSRTGTEAVNDRLSLARATAVRTLLEREAPGLERRLRVTGLGFRRNLIGTGTDDASDALDRRVEFEVVTCES
jgi:outer membrane protein OmpA-like peptidoglycan-associated protein